jgi:hypothetical protein
MSFANVEIPPPVLKAMLPLERVTSITKPRSAPASEYLLNSKLLPALDPLSATALIEAVNLVLPEVRQKKSLVVPAAALIWKLLEVITGTEKVADPEESVSLLAKVVVPIVVVSNWKEVPLAVEVKFSAAAEKKLASSTLRFPTVVPH